MNTVKKMIWAVDPFVEDKASQRASARAVHELAKDGAYEVEPVYVLKGDAFDIPMRWTAELTRQLQVSAQDELNGIMGKLSIQGLRPVTILADAYSSSRAGARSLMSYARSQGVVTIVIGTRARKGPARWAMGSFAETLSLIADVPLLIVNPHTRTSPNFRKILFATDFSPSSKYAFDQVVEFARTHRSKIVIFNRAGFGWTSEFGPAFNVYPEFQKIYEEDIAWRKREAKLWIEQAARVKVEATELFDYRRAGSTAKLILDKASKHGGIVAMAAQSAAVSAALMGSTTRKVIRESSVPVWVIHAPLETPESQKTTRKATVVKKTKTNRVDTPSAGH